MIDSVLLIAFGGPTAPEEIRPFLEIVTRGRRISEERLDEVARHYEQMPGGRSPINELTRAQARALEAMLEREGMPLRVFVGHRNWHPFLRETLEEMAAQGLRRTLGIILSSFRTEASWDRYQADVAAALAKVGGVPEVVYAPPWFAHPLFIEAMSDRAQAALAEVPEPDRAWAPMIFTAHSVPVAMAEESPYVADFATAAHAVASRLARPRYTLAYQSRSGSPSDPWLEPDVNAVLRSFAADPEKHAVVVPIGFVCDHVEILYDLDVDARLIAAQHGLTMHRAKAVNDHPTFVGMLADLAREARGKDSAREARA